MPTNTLNGRSFEVDEEGSLVNRDEWSEELARDMVALIDIDLDDEHLAPLRFMRADQARTGTPRRCGGCRREGGFNLKRLFALYPGKTAKKMAWLADLKNPIGCVRAPSQRRQIMTRIPEGFIIPDFR